jgi:hypothetical protein
MCHVTHPHSGNHHAFVALYRMDLVAEFFDTLTDVVDLFFAGAEPHRDNHVVP